MSLSTKKLLQCQQIISLNKDCHDGTILCPPQIHPELEDPLNLDKENDKIEESSSSK